jgi:small subunit ribosomal protein S6
MPLYELFCMARPALQRDVAGQLMRKAATAVLSRGGILTDIRSYGDRELAYEIRRPGLRMSEVYYFGSDAFSLSCTSGPSSISQSVPQCPGLCVECISLFAVYLVRLKLRFRITDRLFACMHEVSGSVAIVVWVAS